MAAPIQLDRTEGALRGLPADGGVPATLAPVRGKAFPSDRPIASPIACPVIDPLPVDRADVRKHLLTTESWTR